MAKEYTDKEFFTEIENSPDTTLVYYWSPGSEPCKMMDPVMGKFESKYHDKMSFAKINAEQSPIVSNRYAIISVPTCILFGNGDILAQAMGYLELSELEEIFREYIKG